VTAGTVSLGVFGRDPLSDEQRWADVFAAIDELVPVLAPKRWDADEPLRKKWEGERSAREAGHMGGLLAVPKAGGNLTMDRKNAPVGCHTSLRIDAPAPDDLEQAALVDLLRRLAVAMDANYGYLHLLPPPPWKSGRVRYADHYEGHTSLLIPEWILELYLPNIYWGNVFGVDYVGFFGRDRLLSAPAAVVDLFDDDRFYFQATERLADCLDDNERYVVASRAVMDHLGRDAFVDPAHYQRPGRTPDFSYLRDEAPPRPYKPLPP
jgi:hypothetical protein